MAAAKMAQLVASEVLIVLASLASAELPALPVPGPLPGMAQGCLLE